jgi:hypothetical protein
MNWVLRATKKIEDVCYLLSAHFAGCAERQCSGLLCHRVSTHSCMFAAFQGHCIPLYLGFMMCSAKITHDIITSTFLFLDWLLRTTSIACDLYDVKKHSKQRSCRIYGMQSRSACISAANELFTVATIT